MKNKEFQHLMLRAAVRQPFSASLAMRVYADDGFQKKLFALGTAKPIIIIVGGAGFGKTSSIRASIGKHREIKFGEGAREVKKLVQEMRAVIKEGDLEKLRENKVLLLDNFPTPISRTKLDMANRSLEYVIDIFSEDEDAPILIITGEPQIIEELEKQKYLIGRVMPISMPNIDEDEELYDIRNKLIEYQAEYEEMWQEFHIWAEENPADEGDFALKLIEFRKRYSKDYESRRTGQAFCFYYSMLRLSGFFNKTFGQSIEMKDIEENVRRILCWKEAIRETPNILAPSYEVNVWNIFVETPRTIKAFLPRYEPCPGLYDGTCQNDISRYGCHLCDYSYGNYNRYNFMDLRLPEGTGNAILISEPRKIPDFPRHVPCNTPILIVGAQSLPEMLNNSLEEYARRHCVSVRSITPKRLTKELFSHNLCLFQYVDIGHKAYTFPTRNIKGYHRRAIFIKLTNKQYEQLLSTAEDVPTEINYDESDVINMKKELRLFCKEVQSLVGDVGVKADIIESIDD